MTPEQLTAAKLAVMDRLHTACLTIACDPPVGPKQFYSAWPRHRLEYYDAEEFGSVRSDEAVTKGLIAPPEFAPTPKEWDDCLPALSLMDGLPWINHRVVMLRAHQLWYGEHAYSDEDHARWRGGWRAIAAMCNMKNPMKPLRLHARSMSFAFGRSLKIEETPPLKSESEQRHMVV